MKHTLFCINFVAVCVKQFLEDDFDCCYNNMHASSHTGFTSYFVEYSHTVAIGSHTLINYLILGLSC